MVIFYEECYQSTPTFIVKFIRSTGSNLGPDVSSKIGFSHKRSWIRAPIFHQCWKLFKVSSEKFCKLNLTTFHPKVFQHFVDASWKIGYLLHLWLPIKFRIASRNVWAKYSWHRIIVRRIVILNRDNSSGKPQCIWVKVVVLGTILLLLYIFEANLCGKLASATS